MVKAKRKKKIQEDRQTGIQTKRKVERKEGKREKKILNNWRPLREAPQLRVLLMSHNSPSKEGAY